MATRTRELAATQPVLRNFLSHFFWGYIQGAPTDGVTGAGEAISGSLLVDESNKILYKNTGTLASPVWNPVGGVAASEITLAEGWILVGNSSGLGVALDGGASTSFLVSNGTTLVAVTMSSDATMAANGAVTVAANAITEQKMLINLPVSVPIQAVLGNRGGASSDGVMVGAITHTAAADVVQENNGSASFIDETADAASGTGDDVEIPDPFDTSDALYIGHGTIFSAVVIDMSTQGSGAASEAETVYEYYNGSSWAALTEVEDSSAALETGTGTYVWSFLPPSDWAVTAIDGGSSLFFVRFRATADDVYNTTQPKIGQIWVLPLITGGGPQMPFDCTVTAIEGTALVASATNDDTEILLINVTAGTFAQFTWTGAELADSSTGLTLAFTAGDVYAVQILTEDGSTEFDGVSLQLICSVG